MIRVVCVSAGRLPPYVHPVREAAHSGLNKVLLLLSAGRPLRLSEFVSTRPKVTYVDLVRLLRVLSVKSWQDLLADERLPCFLAVNVRCTRHTGGIILHLEGCHLLQLNCLPLKNVCDGDGEWFDVYLL